jgi:hypothetical protein
MNWCATEYLISVAHVLVRHRMLIFVAKILWSTTHAPQNTYIGAPQMRFSLLVKILMCANLSCSFKMLSKWFTKFANKIKELLYVKKSMFILKILE